MCVHWTSSSFSGTIRCLRVFICDTSGRLSAMTSGFVFASEAIFNFQFQRTHDFWLLPWKHSTLSPHSPQVYVRLYFFRVFWLYHEIPSFSFSSMASCIIYFLNMIIGVWWTARLPGVLRAGETLSTICWLPCWKSPNANNFRSLTSAENAIICKLDYICN